MMGSSLPSAQRRTAGRAWSACLPGAMSRRKGACVGCRCGGRCLLLAGAARGSVGHAPRRVLRAVDTMKRIGMLCDRPGTCHPFRRAFAMLHNMMLRTCHPYAQRREGRHSNSRCVPLGALGMLQRLLAANRFH